MSWPALMGNYRISATSLLRDVATVDHHQAVIMSRSLDLKDLK